MKVVLLVVAEYDEGTGLVVRDSALNDDFDGYMDEFFYDAVRETSPDPDPESEELQMAKMQSAVFVAPAGLTFERAKELLS